MKQGLRNVKGRYRRNMKLERSQEKGVMQKHSNEEWRKVQYKLRMIGGRSGPKYLLNEKISQTRNR